MYRLLALLAFLGGSAAAAQTYTGALAAGDPQLGGGEYYDAYPVVAAAGQWINDDYEGSQRRSHLRVQAQAGGTWQAVVTSYAGSETGDYTLTVSVGGGSGPAPTPPAPPASSDGLVGHWYSGSPSAIQYMDPSTGTSAPTSGIGQFLLLNADGSYRAGGILRTTTYSCTSEVYIDVRGTYRVSGNTLVLDQSGGQSWGHVCGGQTYERTLGAETNTYTFTLDGDTLTRSLDGQPYDVMTRGE
jgi:hypothetical protein